MKLKRTNSAAVTGMGIISCLGNDVDTVAHSLKTGQSGVIFDEQREKLEFRSALTGRIKDFSPGDFGINKKACRSMCEPALYAMAAAKDAVSDACLSEQGVVQEDDDLLHPCYYFSPEIDKRDMDDMLKTAFKNRKDRFFPPEKGYMRMQALKVFGFKGLLWDMAIKFQKSVKN